MLSRNGATRSWVVHKSFIHGRLLDTRWLQHEGTKVLESTPARGVASSKRDHRVDLQKLQEPCRLPH
jgi:hypothetical protein